ncbi:MAG: hypothetical protein IIA61_08430 [Candidatus Marinimicrobia bacterium]|nr:hypothetical protein [Candidatus Neomarinimicrobiota bacterium]
MATITVRNLSEKVVKALKERAKRNNHSMEQEVREILEAQAVDRTEILRRIEEEIWPKIRRPISKEEVDKWIENTWKHEL